MRLLASLILFSSISLLLFFCFFKSIQSKDIQRYYQVNLIYNFNDNNLSINSDDSLHKIISITSINNIIDTGKGSQFYVKISDHDKKYIKFNNASDRFYLGLWSNVGFYDTINKDGDITGGSFESKEINILPTIPYHPDGKKINFYESETNRLALSLDVSDFSTVESEYLSDEIYHSENKSEKNKGNYLIFFLLIITLILFSTVIFLFLKNRSNNKKTEKQFKKTDSNINATESAKNSANGSNSDQSTDSLGNQNHLKTKY